MSAAGTDMNSPIPIAIAEAIRESLDTIERKYRCTILFAVESGSRAWGFPSPDSDFDVRFVYSVPPEHVVSLWPSRDVIEETLPGDLDISGWRSDKALHLLLKATVPCANGWHRRSSTGTRAGSRRSGNLRQPSRHAGRRSGTIGA